MCLCAFEPSLSLVRLREVACGQCWEVCLGTAVDGACDRLPVERALSCRICRATAWGRSSFCLGIGCPLEVETWDERYRLRPTVPLVAPRRVTSTERGAVGPVSAGPSRLGSARHCWGGARSSCSACPYAGRLQETVCYTCCRVDRTHWHSALLICICRSPGN